MYNKFFIIFILFFSFTSFYKMNAQNNLVNTTWKTNEIIGLKKLDVYTLDKIQDSVLKNGNYVHFIDSVNFQSYNKSMGVRSCNINVYGKYYMRADSIFSFSVEYVKYTGMCKIRDEKRAPNETFFYFKKVDDGILLDAFSD